MLSHMCNYEFISLYKRRLVSLYKDVVNIHVPLDRCASKIKIAIPEHVSNFGFSCCFGLKYLNFQHRMHWDAGNWYFYLSRCEASESYFRKRSCTISCKTV